MQRIHYAGEHFLTGTAIADALVAYATALAQRASAASIEIPVQHDDGRRGWLSLVVGPASQLLAEPIEPNADVHEITDEGLVVRMRAATADLGTMRPVAVNRPAEAYDGSVDIDWPDRDAL